MIYLYELYKSVQTRAFGELFYPVSQNKEIQYALNVRQFSTKKKQ
jgi:hypothetical protein